MGKQPPEWTNLRELALGNQLGFSISAVPTQIGFFRAVNPKLSQLEAPKDRHRSWLDPIDHS